MDMQGIFGPFYLFPTEINQILFSYMDMGSIRNLRLVNTLFRMVIGKTITSLHGDVEGSDISWLSGFANLHTIEGTITFSSIDQLERIFALNLSRFTVFDKAGQVPWEKLGEQQIWQLVTLIKRHQNMHYFHIKYAYHRVIYAYDASVRYSAIRQVDDLSCTVRTLFFYDRGFVHIFQPLICYFTTFPIAGAIVLPMFDPTQYQKDNQAELFELPIESIKIYSTMSYYDGNKIMEALKLNKRICETIRYITWENHEDLLSTKRNAYNAYINDCKFIDLDLSTNLYLKVELCDIPLMPWQVNEFLVNFPNIRRINVLIPSCKTKECIIQLADLLDITEATNRLDKAIEFMDQLGPPITGKKDVYLYPGIWCEIECLILFF